MAAFSVGLGLLLTALGLVGVRLGFTFTLALLMFVVGTAVLTGAAVFASSLGVWRWFLLAPLLATLPWIYTGIKVPPVADVATRWDPAVNFLTPPPTENSMEPTQPVLAAFNNHYTDVVAVKTADSPQSRLLAYAAEQNWQVVAQAESAIQLSATSRLFGFTDDIVVEWQPTDGGFEVNARSKSRVGTSDLGANAKRLKALLAVAAN